MAMNLADRIETTTKGGRTDILKQFPKVFQGLGTLGDEFTIQLKWGATPHAPRRVPLPNYKKLRRNLNEWSPWESYHGLMN